MLVLNYFSLVHCTLYMDHHMYTVQCTETITCTLYRDHHMYTVQGPSHVHCTGSITCTVYSVCRDYHKTVETKVTLYIKIFLTRSLKSAFQIKWAFANCKIFQARSQDFPKRGGGAKRGVVVWSQDHRVKRSERA